MKSDYVTHEELNHFEDNLRHEIKESQLETKNSITDLSGKIDKVSANIDTKFEKVNTHFEIINTKFANQKVWIITTIVSTVGVGVGLLSFIMNLMLHK
ncbi:hypothetical protein IWT25_00703 [Secundilactobacillus pentosiphilus]|uniref:Uncharacterized protein n=2 Tax=Secundilactobacillus pentosiphilus TaxID=1714682 RepID=A0A1Z5IUM4_9LACO|nr:hypothetical protein IWT25_00703 [Secundilactobacillus pentosiphilus]